MIAPHSPDGTQAYEAKRPEAASTADPNPLDELKRSFARLQLFVAHYLAAQADSALMRVRNLVLYVAVGLLGLVVAMAGLVTAVVLLLVGAARGLGDLIDDRLWAGELIVGAAIIGLLVLAIVVVLRRLKTSSFRAAREKYDYRHVSERSTVGRDVFEQAARARTEV